MKLRLLDLLQMETYVKSLEYFQSKKSMDLLLQKFPLEC